MRHILPLILAAVLLGGISQIGLAETLGAHPWWAGKVVYIGAPVGLAVAALLNLTRLPALARLAGFAALLIAAYAIAHTGKTQFAASFAEDAAAGRMWYVGWIATSAAFAATLTTALHAIRF